MIPLVQLWMKNFVSNVKYASYFSGAGATIEERMSRIIPNSQMPNKWDQMPFRVGQMLLWKDSSEDA